MAITTIARDLNSPNLVRVTSTDNLATVAGAGYVDDQIDNTTALNHGLWQWLEGDLIDVAASDGNQIFEFDGDDFSTFVQLPGGNGEVTLPVVDNDFVMFDGTLGALQDLGMSASDATKTKVVMADAAVTANAIAVFADTAGTVKNASTTTTLAQPLQVTGSITASTSLTATAGNITSGSSGDAGTFISFPATAANGTLIVAAANAGGAFNTTVSNGSMAQSTVYTIGDIGAASGGIPVSTGAVRMKMVADAVAAGGSATQSISDAFCTAASVVLAVWQTQTNPAVIQRVVPGAGSFDIISDVDAGAGTVNYVIMK